MQALGAENRTGFEAARDLRPHGDLRRRLVAGQRSAASQAPSLLPPHPLSFLRRRLVGVSTQSSHCQDSAGSTAPLLVNRSEVLPRTRWRVTRRAHKACSHGALIHGVRTTQRLAFAAAATSSLLLRPGLFPARSSRLPRVPRQEGRWATARASTARSEVNYSPSISARQARRVGRARCAVLASHPLRRALSTSIPRTPAHNLRVRRARPSPAW